MLSITNADGLKLFSGKVKKKVLRQKLWIKGFTKKQNFIKESFIS